MPQVLSDALLTDPGHINISAKCDTGSEREQGPKSNTLAADDALHHGAVEDARCVGVVAEGHSRRQHLVQHHTRRPHINARRVVHARAQQHLWQLGALLVTRLFDNVRCSLCGMC